MTTAAPTATAPAPAARTPTDASPSRRRRVATWVAIAVVLFVIGGVGAAISAANQWAQRGQLDPDSAGPAGTRALAQILREHGVEVTVARDRTAVADALDSGTATLVLPDAPALSDEALDDLAARASDVVLIEPRERTLDLLLAGSGQAGYASGDVVAPECIVGDARRAGGVAPGAVYRPGDDVTGCYPAADGYGLLVQEDGDRRLSAVDGGELFTNEHLAEHGDAALGVNLMGRHPLVVWYVPSPGDTDLTDADPTLGDLTPPWVSPVIVLLLIAGIAAGIWRGRRFGPLVVERLPVMVRASETTEGRARLYARARDPLHAADRLRIGALRRIAALLGLASNAAAPDIADAAAGRLGVDRAVVRGILIDEIPQNDAELVTLSTRLRDLEDAVRSAVRPERSHS